MQYQYPNGFIWKLKHENVQTSKREDKYKFILKITIVVCFIWMNAIYETAPAVDIASGERVKM